MKPGSNGLSLRSYRSVAALQRNYGDPVTDISSYAAISLSRNLNRTTPTNVSQRGGHTIDTPILENTLLSPHRCDLPQSLPTQLTIEGKKSGALTYLHFSIKGSGRGNPPNIESLIEV